MDSSKEYVGVIAQDLQQAIPEAVTKEAQGDFKDYLTINTTPVLWTIINAIKEMYHKVVGVEDQVSEMKREVASVKAESAAKDQKIKELEERLLKIEKALEEK